MVSRSSDKTESVRVTAAESDAARDALAALEREGSPWKIGDVLRAVVAAVGAKPRETLAYLAPYLREQKKAGRPRKAAPPATD